MYWAGHMIGSLLTVFGGAPSKSEGREIRRSSLLTLEDKILYDKLVHDLLNSNSTSALVVFRQSASWKTVQDQLLYVNDVKWKTKWQERIIHLFGLQQRVHECAAFILHAAATDPMNPKVATLKNEIDRAKDDIALILRACEKDLIADCSDPNLKSDSTVAPVLDHLKNNWPNLIVFGDWAEVKMDSDAMCVQVQRVSVHKRVKVIEFCPATKGIFWIKQKNQKGSTNAHENSCPSPNLLRRASGPLKLDEETFVSFKTIEPEFSPTLITPEHIKSEQGDRLHRIVNRALDRINDITALQEGRINKVDSSQTRGIRYDLAFFNANDCSN